jgi:hypothetical protein
VAIIEEGELLMLEDLPTVKFSTARIKHRIDGAGLAELLEPFAGSIRMAIVEKVAARPGEAPSGAFSFGFSAGAISGVLGALRVPVTTVAPATWKKAMGLGPDKDLSRARAIELFPAAASKLALKKQHDRAEALLLAEYGRRTQA